MPTVVTMPKWGLTMTAGTVTGWSAAEGDDVSAGAPLLTVETEKAVNDVEVPADGVLRKIVAETGTEVPVSGPVAVILAPGEELSDEEVAALVVPAASSGRPGATAASARPSREARAAARDEGGRINASPAARKAAREAGIDLASVAATGPNGRITSKDVERAIAEGVPSAKRETGEPVVREEFVGVTDGPRLFAIDAGSRDSSPPLLFLHGLGGAQTTWSGVLEALVARHRVIAFELPGHGQSDKPDPDEFSYSVDGLALAVAAAIEAMDLPPAVLVGHSLGGAIATTVALDRPDLVRALVMIDGAGLGSDFNPELLDRVEAEPSAEETRRLLELFYEDTGLIRDRGVAEMHQARLVPGADAALRAAAAVNFDRRLQRIAIHGRLAEIAVPTLIVWGDRDRVFPVEQAGAAAEVIPGAWLEVIDGIGHVPQVEAPDLLAALLDRFVCSLPDAV